MCKECWIFQSPADATVLREKNVNWKQSLHLLANYCWQVDTDERRHRQKWKKILKSTQKYWFKVWAVRLCHYQRMTSCLHTCASVTKQYNLMTANWHWCPVAGKVIRCAVALAMHDILQWFVHLQTQMRWASHLHFSSCMAHFTHTLLSRRWSYRPHNAPRRVNEPSRWLLHERGMLFRRLFVLRHRSCSSAVTSRRHCFSHRTLHYSVRLCDRL